LHKITAIEHDLMKVKLSLLKKFAPSDNKVVSLKGIINGVDVTDDDVIAAQSSLYGRVKV
jgi:hypothetical protein